MDKGLLVISTASGVVVYSLVFLLLFRAKFLRNLAQSAGQEVFLTTEVILGCLTLVITLTGIAIVFVDRVIAGKYFFIAAILGVILTALSTAALLNGPFEPPTGLENYAIIGLVIGNIVIVACNMTVMYLPIPSI